MKTAPLKLVENPEVPDISIRYASTDEDICNIHRFLMIVAQPVLMCPVDPIKSLNEIIRVAKFEVALMAVHNGIMVGTMGIIKPTWWYGDGEFLTDRWHFVLPAFDHTPTSAALMDEAKEIARLADLKFIHQGKIRGVKHGVARLMPRLYAPESGITAEVGE